MAATLICPVALKDCDCLDFPISNYSVFDEDVPVFIANVTFADDPPLGNTFTKSSCLGICESSVSQEAADECALQAAQLCVWDTFRAPVQGDGYIPKTIYYSTEQSCEVICDDLSLYTYTVKSGSVLSRKNQADADAKAESLACKRGNALVGLWCFDLPAGCLSDDTPYSFQFIGIGSGSTFNLVGALPVGLTFTHAGLLSGTPLTSGSFPITVTVTDANGDTLVKSMTLSVIEITTAATLPAGSVDTPYSKTLTATGTSGTQVWSVTHGSLPPGLTLSNAGVLSGTPTDGNQGFMFTARVVDGAGAGCSKEFTIEINAIPVPSLYWTLDDSLADSISSVALTASAVNYASGIINDGFHFPATINTSIDLQIINSASVPYALGQSVTMSFWMNLSVDFDANDQVIVQLDDGPTGNLRISVRWQRILGVTNVVLELADGTNFSQQFLVYPVTLGSWDFLTVAYNAVTGLAVLYRNGTAIITSTTPVFLPAAPQNSIRHRSVGGFSGATMNYVFDEWGWWFSSVPLSAAQVGLLYNGGTGSRPPFS